MKKFLLSFALLAAGATMMNAASFEVSVNGETISDGATITHATIEQNMPEYGLLSMEPTIAITNTSSANASYTVTAKAISLAPNATECTSTDSEIYPTSLQFCIGTYCQFISETGTTLESSLSVEAGQTNSKDVHVTYSPCTEVNYVTYAILVSYNGKSEFQFTVTSGSETVTFNMVFDYNGGTNGIDGIEVDNNVAPEYFNLQGVRVANPDKGIYIVRRGNKVSKEIVK